MAAGRLIGTLAAAGVALALAAPLASADDIRVQSTSDTTDAGLVEGLLRGAYAAVQPGDTLAYNAVGTGKALENARAGQADVVITHAPSLEAQFVADGYSLEPAGRAIFYSDYVVVGPADDPAGVAATAPHDAVAAYEAIAAAGADGRATFVSRGEDSGTNVQEQIIWGLSNVTKSAARTAGSDRTRFEPTRTADTVGDYPAWYVKTDKKQGANLRDTDACVHPNGGCYTMVDRGTFNNLLDRGEITRLKVLSENNSAEARGGKDLLINPFSAYIVNPDKIPAVNVAAARRFIDFLVSPAFQSAVDVWPTATQPAFRADAFPSVRATLPPTATAGAAASFTVAFANKQPGAPAVVGMPVQLQQSTDNGASWSDAGAPALTDGTGNASFAPTVNATTRYRVSLGLFKATSWNAFSPSVQELGTIGVTPVPDPTPIDRRPALAKDTVKPKVSKPAFTNRSLTLTVSEAATVRATVRKRTVKRVRVKGKPRNKVVWVAVRSLSGRTTRAARLKLTWKRPLPGGTYRVGVRVTDRAGNSRSQTLALLTVPAKKAVRR
ncbi:substrate-binding domain-containing protein [Conexibacter sp. JD483]|uniref:substrate-binding domain-containing protein n=1 Tax=unclassified Conexibacter TaxID=2627773 RepID=UPI00271BA9E6|nr:MULTISPECIES: substrate-binding domain-containing protein [unclassified Conexibacter]MDO8184726.1 substrate-binding domain-containing protein [Conexibacter sp. CPCC 205706]MDO8198032.1 substrate-binding domain-containing protein [Conexibacter sp. CPCC 205762]MDR9372990.1 substrate-binding domain-containing protein [Conexibacter sp. JD483]